ncbi:hypothetical protein D3C73_731680 [compost metagenome]
MPAAASSRACGSAPLASWPACCAAVASCCWSASCSAEAAASCSCSCASAACEPAASLPGWAASARSWPASCCSCSRSLLSVSAEGAAAEAASFSSSLASCCFCSGDILAICSPSCSDAGFIAVLSEFCRASPSALSASVCCISLAHCSLLSSFFWSSSAPVCSFSIARSSSSSACGDVSLLAKFRSNSFSASVMDLTSGKVLASFSHCLASSAAFSSCCWIQAASACCFSTT